MSVVPNYTGGDKTYGDYLNLPEDGKRYELIDGEIIMLASPTIEHHDYVMYIYTQINSFLRNNKDCSIYVAPVDVVMIKPDADKTDLKAIKKVNFVLQPDVFVVCDPKEIDKSKRRIQENGCYGAPDLVIEVVSKSSVRMDYIHKLSIYEKYGVKEYWIVDPINRKIRLYNLQSDIWLENDYSITGIVRSNLLNGLKIDFSEYRQQ
ncbi:Uma2 family endonuclease [Tyzzerella sp. OttesenSCG-928-J15]|nr:Uma2 family endonuclease [Tyzzerella sp. OttesenSCG-928-J15]